MSTLSDDAWERWLKQSLDRPARQPALLLVEGPAGTGKSRLVDRLLAASEGGPRPRIVLTFVSCGSSLAYHPGARPGTAGDRGANPEATPLSSRVHPDAAALAEELTPLLESDGPVLLIAEDVHRADPASRELLRRVLERPPAGLATVLAYRPEELTEPGLVLGRAVAYPARLSLLRIRLEPLDAQQVRTMVEERLGAESCPPELIARIHERSAGVPQVVVDLVRQLEDVCGPRERYGARDVDATGTPVRLAELVLGRLAALPPEQRAVAGAAAVLDEPSSAEDLYAVAALPAETGRSALVAALRAAVLQETGSGLYGFPSPLAGTAVYQELPGPLRQDLHRRAATVLAHRRPVPWARLATHRRRGGRLRGWLKAVERAAEQCAEAGDHQTAMDLLEQALSHPAVPREVRARLAPLLAHSAVLGLHTDQTVQVLRQILDEQSLPPAVRGQIRLDLGLVLYNQAGMGLQGWVELEQAVDELAERPALAARAMSALAMPVMSAVPLERNLHWLEKVQKMAARSDDPEVRTAVAASCIAVQLEIGDPTAWEVLDRLREETVHPERLPHVARGVVNAADASLWLGHLRRVGDLLEEGLDLAARSGASYVEQDGRGSVLLLDWITGRWNGLAGRARAFVAESGVMPGPAADARIVLGMLALAQGEWQQMAAWLSGRDAPCRSAHRCRMSPPRPARWSAPRSPAAMPTQPPRSRRRLGPAARQGRLGVGGRTGALGRRGDRPRGPQEGGRGDGRRVRGGTQGQSRALGGRGTALVPRCAAGDRGRACAGCFPLPRRGCGVRRDAPPVRGRSRHRAGRPVRAGGGRGPRGRGVRHRGARILCPAADRPGSGLGRRPGPGDAPLPPARGGAAPARAPELRRPALPSRAGGCRPGLRRAHQPGDRRHPASVAAHRRATRLPGPPEARIAVTSATQPCTGHTGHMNFLRIRRSTLRTGGGGKAA